MPAISKCFAIPEVTRSSRKSEQIKRTVFACSSMVCGSHRGLFHMRLFYHPGSEKCSIATYFPSWMGLFDAFFLRFLTPNHAIDTQRNQNHAHHHDTLHGGIQ